MGNGIGNIIDIVRIMVVRRFSKGAARCALVVSIVSFPVIERHCERSEAISSMK
jgi:hypothetical protein